MQLNFGVMDDQWKSSVVKPSWQAVGDLLNISSVECYIFLSLAYGRLKILVHREIDSYSPI